jgi:hypothetical protein
MTTIHPSPAWWLLRECIAPVGSNPKIENTRAGLELMTGVKSDAHICHCIVKDGMTSPQQATAVALQAAEHC